MFQRIEHCNVFFYTMHRSEQLLRKIKQKCVVYNLLSNFTIHWTLARMEFYLQLRDKWLDKTLVTIFCFWTLFSVQMDKFNFLSNKQDILGQMISLFEQNRCLEKLSVCWTDQIFVCKRKLFAMNINLRFTSGILFYKSVNKIVINSQSRKSFL